VRSAAAERREGESVEVLTGGGGVDGEGAHGAEGLSLPYPPTRREKQRNAPIASTASV
jgi:hypothetical protein